jgi:type IV pilus assembly protein PilW
LIEGVEDLQISYAVDTTNPDPDKQPDFVDPDADGDPYLTGAQIAGNVPGSSAAEKWGRVVSVKVSLLMRSVENNVGPQSQSYSYNGSDETPDDRYIRKVFTHVIKLRNR